VEASINNYVRQLVYLGYEERVAKLIVELVCGGNNVEILENDQKQRIIEELEIYMHVAEEVCKAADA